MEKERKRAGFYKYFVPTGLESTMPSVNGALIIDKPAGFTSHDVVARVRKIIGERRVGHTGTLDPFATGVLVILVGRATRLAQFLSGAEKEYEAVIRLGFATDTGDSTGTRVERFFTTEARRSTEIHREEVEAAIASLRGEIEQTPPMYSAKKVGGSKLYELARRGQEVERQPVRVVIHKFEMIENADPLLKTSDDRSADLCVRVVCSAGTYIRTLAEDFGKELGIGAHLAELRRTSAGQFKIESAVRLDQLAALAAENSLDKILISPNDTLSDLPSIELNEEQAKRTRHGIDFPINADEARSWNNGVIVRMAMLGELIGVGRFDSTRAVVHPDVVLETV
jgi:tRNA pseudouridine55 synthase